ncbi:MAG: hypothetical protein A2784_00840 [Candidatus Chisholmbacteria bacterium RIFCSPHIGHO2_01_FULL_48_12]|uniref:Ribbon-helix-helix protein CopG domain-containing protein n=1 Tax=Candidatus Chisholmbacteria bacterium RIFCSPHIGHO2_01_FULL_48_12 TaxID=1797589 RepID=A0A1G1VQP2_9BACT|nr:MAG: hypothetical protein A2784_00840 [Candidatus Chisholmbacteria bacterium RIFCSPHIGHO2_01_FULL_48_12]
MATAIIRLPEDEYELYKELARDKAISVAEYFRRAARKQAGIGKKKKYSIWDLGTKLVFEGGPRDGARNFDKYLYEAERAKMRRNR